MSESASTLATGVAIRANAPPAPVLRSIWDWLSLPLVSCHVKLIWLADTAVAANPAGAAAGDTATPAPVVIEVPAPPAVRAAGAKQLAEFRLGRTVAAQTGCLACHKIGHQGNRGPGPNLTHVGSRLPRLAIERTLERPTLPMPSFKGLKRQRPARFHALAVFLSLLR